MSFRTVCKLDEIPAGEGKIVAVGRRIIALFRPVLPPLLPIIVEHAGAPIERSRDGDATVFVDIRRSA